MDIRIELVKIFQDTMNWIKSDLYLSQALQASMKNTILYKAEDYPDLPDYIPRETTIAVSADKSFQAAMRLRKQFPDTRIAVHNFASAVNPGGGVTRGSRAQEEALCRCSTLYPCLNLDSLWQNYYQFHRDRRDVRYTDACIYSPDIRIIKSDDDLPQRLPESDFCQVDILTCAAPNLRSKPYNLMNPDMGTPMKLNDQEQADLHKPRARHLLTVAASHHVDILVLGAFGCGAFRNNPYVVAQVYRDILSEPAFKDRFLHIEFAVYHTPRDADNLKAFSNIFS